MNSDEVMSDPAPANTTAAMMAGPGSIQGIIDAAAQNQSQAQAHAQIKANTWNTNKFREEYEAAKSRLSDQKFNITDYPDPLISRAPALKQTRLGQTAESEQKLRKLIARIKASSGDGHGKDGTMSSSQGGKGKAKMG